MVWRNNAGVLMSAGWTIWTAMFGSASIGGTAAADAGIISGQQRPPAESANHRETLPQAEPLEVKMARRFPQQVKVADLIGLPVLDDDDVTLGHVQQVVRSPQGKTKLIVTYSRWFGWLGHPVAVPIEAVAIFGKQLASLEMPPAEYEKAPTWMAGTDRPLPESELSALL
jgi:PRC-barrel domain